MALFSKKYSRFKNRQKSVKKTVLFVLKGLVFVFLVYEFLWIFFIQTYRVGSVSMEPEFKIDERVLATPLFYGPKYPFSNRSIFRLSKPERGDVVLCQPGYYQNTPWFMRIWDPIVRFFSFQAIDISASVKKSWEHRVTMLRVVGIPGDTIKIQDSIAYIKPNGSDHFEKEFDLIKYKYNIIRERAPEGWSASLPFSGNTKEIRLGKGEYYLLGDNRSDSNDSIYWGSISIDEILSKVIIQYWPWENFSVY